MKLWTQSRVFLRRLREGYSLRESWNFGSEVVAQVKDMEKAGKVWLSWYRDPINWNGKHYLVDDIDHETGKPDGGHWYTTDRDRATRYTREEALKLTPKYDGSSGIAKRAGIERA